ncbi:shikimate dehydrogenase [Roseinatronobacter alkalisoli]|uniref:Shikimate dehydrogenase (NADP(+)) n=1 Tax=Roseinatronobacter alkalisoli TaxID=3028235 RepID=A0ABT5T9R0_9RHOB|nr:shikimate dehydrogenase [Roseinatronobacter sp. HJB301]MDD7971863.1 shikimate dehydrogenase [Roseinatronobacter sp. HJB301]
MSKIPLAGVIGCPIGHSKSPLVHGSWLREYGLRGHYVPLHVDPADLETVLRTMPRMGFVGANVTIPHKEHVLTLADDVSPVAARIGAANTLTFGADGHIHADNTDGYGFLANLRQAAPDWQPSAAPALVLGAGGAARAVIVALLDAGVPEVRLCNRTRARAEGLAQEFGPQVTVCDWADRAQGLDDLGLLVNTSALGMAGNPALDMPLDGLSPAALVTDIVYTPLMTDLLIRAQARGNPVVDGLGMLLHQAVPGFERWFGQTPQVTDALRLAVLGQ